MKTKFYLCATCGNVVVKMIDSGVDLVCCGSEMVELKPGTSDGMAEKHLPVVECLEGGIVRVKVGSIAHPMSPEHRIMFIYVETEHGGLMRYLDANQPAEADFCVCNDRVVAVYAYCNIHGLWKTNIVSGAPDHAGSSGMGNCHQTCYYY